DHDELHDALMSAGFLTASEITAVQADLFDRLVNQRRAATVAVPLGAQPFAGRATRDLWIAAERLPEICAVHPDASVMPGIEAPPSRRLRTWTRDEAIVELLRSRMTIVGPATAASLATTFGIAVADCDAALLGLESEGVVLRGRF